MTLMYRMGYWIADVLKKIVVNLVTVAGVLGMLYFAYVWLIK